MKKMFLVFSFLTLAHSAFAETALLSVQKAHDAYLRGDGNALVANIKSALEQSIGQTAIQKNMLALYAAAAKNGVLKGVEPNWHLPKEITWASFESHRRYKPETGKVVFFLDTSFSTEPGAVLEQFQVIRYPDQIILDKAANIGHWTVNPGINDIDIWGGTPQTISPNEEGLYLFNIQFKGQPMMQGWFIMADKNSSASPVITSPKMGEVFTDTQPVFKWRAFSSPEKKLGEGNSISIRVTKALPDEPEVSQAHLLDPKATAYKYADKTAVREFTGPDRLTPGDYISVIVYREIEDFGDLHLRRSSSTRVPFSVRP